MKISSINSTLEFQNQNKMNFKGLWGKETQEVLSSSHYSHGQMCDVGTDHTVITKEYHPFLDESADEITKTIKEHTKTERGNFECADWIKEVKVVLMPKLEISAADFKAYKAKELLSKAENTLEDALKIAKLQKYLRK